MFSNDQAGDMHFELSQASSCGRFVRSKRVLDADLSLPFVHDVLIFVQRTWMEVELRNQLGKTLPS